MKKKLNKPKKQTEVTKKNIHFMILPHLMLSIYLSYWLKYLNYYSCTLKLIHKFIVSTYWHNRSENYYLLSLFKLFIYFLFQVSMISFSKSIFVFKVWFSNFILFTVTLMLIINLLLFYFCQLWMQFVRRKRKKNTCRNWRKDFFKKENLHLHSGTKIIDCANNNIIIIVLNRDVHWPGCEFSSWVLNRVYNYYSLFSILNGICTALIITNPYDKVFGECMSVFIK